MPELSKPLIAILGVVISVAILFIAVAGFLPFFQQAVTGPAQQAQFTGTAVASVADSTIVFSVNIQKLVGTGTYYIDDANVTVVAPNGTSALTFTMTPENVTFTADTVSVGFSIRLNPGAYDEGTWVIVINIVDKQNMENVIQTLSLEVTV